MIYADSHFYHDTTALQIPPTIVILEFKMVCHDFSVSKRRGESFPGACPKPWSQLGSYLLVTEHALFRLADYVVLILLQVASMSLIQRAI